MTAWKKAWWLPAVASLAFLPLHIPSALSADQDNQNGVAQAAPQQALKAPARVDRGKNDVIEPAIKNVVRNTAPAATPVPATPKADPRLDVGKRAVIERPVAIVVGPPAAPPVAPLPPAKPRIDIGKTLVIEPAVKNLVKAGVPANSQPVNVEPAMKEVIKRTQKDVGQTPTAPAKNEGLDVTKTGVVSNPQLAEEKTPPPARPRVDVGKYTIIEPAVRNAVTPNGGISIPVPRLDVGKGAVIEPRVKDIVRGATPPAPPPVAPPAVNTPKGFVNPKVEAGKVKWHATLEEACAASAKSRKPVMLFQMMGKLDDHFC